MAKHRKDKRSEALEALHSSGEDYESALARLGSADRASLALVEGGRLVERPVEVGDAIRRGQLLARVDDRGQRNGVAAADSPMPSSSAA